MVFSVENLLQRFLNQILGAAIHTCMSRLGQVQLCKTGSGMCFNRHIDSDLRGFTRETSSLQTFNCNAQNCHHKINTH
jgi:hypothetical protein